MGATKTKLITIKFGSQNIETDLSKKEFKKLLVKFQNHPDVEYHSLGNLIAFLKMERPDKIIRL